MTNRAVFDQLFREVGRADNDAIAALFCDDGVYHDIPLPTDPTVGKQAIRAKLAPLAAMVDHLSFEFALIVEVGDRIFAERVETWHFPSGETAALPIMCTIEFRGGKISAWREYWDMQTLFGQFPPDVMAAVEKAMAALGPANATPA